MKRYLLFVLIAALLCTGCSVNNVKTDDVKATVSATQPSVSDEYTEPTVKPSEDSTSSAEPPVAQTGDYILDGTKLIGYVGNETELTLPEEVTSIAAYAFRDAPSAAQITKMNLGSKVTEIEVGAFTGMHSLCAFTVDLQNPQFYAYEDHTLVSLDGTLHMGLGTSAGNLGIGVSIGDLQNDVPRADEFTRLVIAGCEFDMDYADGGLHLSSFSAGGQKVFFDPRILIEANHTVQVDEVENGAIISVMYYDVGDSWFLTDDGVIEFKDGLTDAQRAGYEANGVAEYNYAAYRLYNAGDGRLGYKRKLRKYNVLHSVDAAISVCVDREELYNEVGMVNIVDGQLEFIPVTVYSVSDVIDIDEHFRVCKESGLFTEYSTLDELLTANAEKYERGY